MHIQTYGTDILVEMNTWRRETTTVCAQRHHDDEPPRMQVWLSSCGSHFVTTEEEDVPWWHRAFPEWLWPHDLRGKGWGTVNWSEWASSQVGLHAPPAAFVPEVA